MAPRLFLIDARWEDEVRVTDKLREFLKEKDIKKLALFAAVQFEDLENFISELEEMEIEILTTKAKRTEKVKQILGCDCYPDAYKDDIINEADQVLYIGDGMFHPKAIALAQAKSRNPTPFNIFDPISDRVIEVGFKDVEELIKRKIRNLKMFLNAKTVGIMVTTKPGQQYLDWVRKLKEKMENEGKKAYIFIDNTYDFSSMENYPFIDCWVNSACPRIGTDDIVNIEKPLINVRDAFRPVEELEEFESRLR